MPKNVPASPQDKASAKALAKKRSKSPMKALQRDAKMRKYRFAGGVVGAAVVAVLILVIVSSQGTKSKSPSQLIDTSGGTVQTVSSVLKGIPQKGTTLGDPSAPVTVTYYGDLQCPICASFATGTDKAGVTGTSGLPKFIQNYVATGKAKLVFKSLCTASCYSEAASKTFFVQQAAAYAAGLQNKFWNYEELFYRQQGDEQTPYVTTSYLTSLAKQAGLNMAQWNKDRTSKALTQQVTNEGTAGEKANVTGTPTVFVSTSKGSGKVGVGVIDYSTLVNDYKAALDGNFK